MNAKTQSIFASLLEIAAGAWVMLVPAFTSVTGAALVSVLVTGGAIALLGLVQLFWENVIPSWVEGVVAIWLFVSAYAFTYSTAAMWNVALAAILTFVLALWDGVEVLELREQHQHG